MKWYVHQIATTAEGTATAITEYLNLDLARMAFHQIMASAYANQNVYYALCMMTDQFGNIMMNENFERPMPGLAEA